MIDSVTKQRITVEVDSEHGLVVRLSDWEDKDYLEDILTEKYDVEYDYYKPEKDASGNDVAFTLYFGNKIERALLQKIIDGVGD